MDGLVCSRQMNKNNFAKDLFSGACAGALSAAITCPLDLVKTRMQFKVPYKDTLHGILSIAAKDGIKGLYCGLSVTLISYIPSWAIYFSVYQHCKMHFSNLQSAVAAGFISTTLTNPLWVLKSRIMAPETRVYFSVFSAFDQILKKEGKSAFFRGIVPSLFGVSHAAVQLPLYEILKSNGLLTAICISKLCASAITYPHEVLRTRMQNQKIPLSNLVLKMYKNEGLKSFYRGIGANFLRTLPNTCIVFFTYEHISFLLRN